jgi:thioredoxin reductase (NADPH)
MNKIFDALVIGSGPAGCSASIYISRGGASVGMFLGPLPGGILTTTISVENYPGYVSINGTELMNNMIEQSKEYGTVIIEETVINIKKEADLFLLQTEKNIFYTRSVILATGAVNKKLGILSEFEYSNKGVSYCAICDGFFFKDMEVAVIGGGNSAIEEVLFLSKIAKKVYLIHRRDSLRGEKILQDRLFLLKNVEFLWNSRVLEFLGNNDKLTHINVENIKDNIKHILKIDGAFIAIGYSPNNKLAGSLADLDVDGYVIDCGDGTTKTPGLFVVGEVSQKEDRQAVVAAGNGCVTGLRVLKFL